MPKSELEKMLAGERYLASDPQLQSMLLRARQSCFEYNQLDYHHLPERQALLRKLFGRIGPKFEIMPPFFCDYGGHIFAGDNLFLNYNCTILDCAHVTIGDNVMMGPNVQLYTAYHPLLASDRIKGPELAAPITIGNNVWIGGGAIICQGVTIGDNTTIGAGAVVVKDVPGNVFAAGNPCRVVKELNG